MPRKMGGRRSAFSSCLPRQQQRPKQSLQSLCWRCASYESRPPKSVRQLKKTMMIPMAANTPKLRMESMELS